jgi:hypothetical protein
MLLRKAIARSLPVWFSTGGTFAVAVMMVKKNSDEFYTHRYFFRLCILITQLPQA